jgi:short-subunit dehydrogenase
MTHAPIRAKDRPMRRAMVTGASMGIGAAFARRLASEGWAVTLVARSRERLAAIVAELPGQGHEVLECDLSRPTARALAVDRIASGEWQLLVNNAGFGQVGHFHETAMDRLRDMMEVNCEAVVELSHAFLRQAQDGDALVNVASALGYISNPNMSLYTATKAFVVALSECLWFENRDRGVFVLCCAPGMTETEFSRNAGRAPSEKRSKLIRQTPEQVVDETMHALLRRRGPHLVTGAPNRLGVGLSRMIGRVGTMRLMARSERRH